MARKKAKAILLFLTTSLWVSLLVNLYLQEWTLTRPGGILLVTALLTLIGLLFTDIRLETMITDEGVQVRFPPLQPAYSLFVWEQIQKIEIRTYRPGEFYGWGIRWFPEGTGFIVAGKHLIDITFVNGKTLLITTNEPEKLETVLRQLPMIR